MKTHNFWAPVLSAALFSAMGCASLQSVSLTSIPRDRGRPIQATENNLAFLGIHFDNDFADEVPDELRRQCPNGKVTGIYAKYESTWYVLLQNRSVTAKAYCVTGPQTAAGASPASPASSTSPALAPTSSLPERPTSGLSSAPNKRETAGS